MRVVIVAAVGRNRAIGVDGGLPWRIPEDMMHFKEVTMGTALVMGRITFESIGRPLPGRVNIVLTHRAGWSHEGVEVAGSLGQAIDVAASRGLDVSVAGGAGVYELALGLADRMELTEVDASPAADSFFPRVDWSLWRETARDPHEGFTFASYQRARPAPDRSDGAGKGGEPSNLR